MKRTLLLLATAALIAGCSDDDSMGPGDGTAVVTMFVNSFTPFTTTIKVGGSVEFDFGADPHNVIFERITGAPADIQQTVNRKVSRMFTVVGKFPYECRLHPGMSGEVVVTP
jgi:plastocyanin